MTALKIQEQLTTLELAKDNLGQYGCWVSMRINNVHRKHQRAFMKRLVNFQRKHV